MAWSDHYVTDSGSDTYANSTNISTPCSLATAIANYAAGDRINIKAGTYTLAGAITFATAGTSTAPVWWRGYKTTPGDLDTAGGSRIPVTDLPKIDADTATDQVIVTANYQTFSNINITSVCTSAGGALSCSSGAGIRFIRCSILNTAANSGARAVSTGTSNVFLGCYFQATTTAGYCVYAANEATIYGCQFVGGATSIYRNNGLGGTVAFCTASGFTTAFYENDNGTITSRFYNCTIYGGGATSGFLVSASLTSGYITIVNCIIGGVVNGINNSSGVDTFNILSVNNQFYDCTNNLVGITEGATVGADYLAALFNFDNDTDPWVNKATANFNLSTGAAACSTAYPGAFDSPNGTAIMTGYPDIGAVRHVDPSGGTTVTVFRTQNSLPNIKVY